MTAVLQRAQVQRGNAPITPHMIEAELVRLSAAMEDATYLYAQQAEEHAAAEVAWKRCEAAFIDMDGAGVERRRASALLQHPGKHDAYVIAEAKLGATEKKLKLLDKQIEVLRTLAANVRAQT